jgi:hypothetical protein
MLLYSNCRASSGSVSLPRSLLDLLPLPAGSPRVFRSAAFLDRNREVTALMALTSTSKRSRERWCRLSATPHSHEIRVRPSSDIPTERPLQGASSLRHRRCQALVHVPPSWFRTTMTVYSARWFAGLLHPAAEPGFVAFPGSLGPVARPGGRWRARGAFPATRFTPFKEFPSSTASATSLRPVAFLP